MTPETVLEILEILATHGVERWIDGGWGVDALLGRETRPHDDLDLVVPLDDAAHIERILGAHGSVLVEDHLPVRFVLSHPVRGQIDFHTVRFDEAGGGCQPQAGGGIFRYPPEGFVTGSIAGWSVPCVSAEIQVLCHLGYEPKEKDVRDVLALHQEIGIELPTVYGELIAAAPVDARAATSHVPDLHEMAIAVRRGVGSDADHDRSKRRRLRPH